MLRGKAETYRLIGEYLEAGKKIKAIKALRIETKAGLKEAKEAIEKMQHERNMGHYPNAAENADSIHCGTLVKRIVLDYGTGDFEVDIESMELRALMDMQTIGLEVCGDVLELVSILKAFAAGKKIEVIDENR